MVNANLQHFLEINSKTLDENLNYVTRKAFSSVQTEIEQKETYI